VLAAAVVVLLMQVGQLMVLAVVLGEVQVL
jgi:hypothetical protein